MEGEKGNVFEFWTEFEIFENFRKNRFEKAAVEQEEERASSGHRDTQTSTEI